MKWFTIILVWFTVWQLSCAGNRGRELIPSRQEAMKQLPKYEEKVRTSPENAKHHYELARAYAALGKQKEAIEAVNRALVLDRKLFDAYLLRARLLKMQGKRLEAYKTYQALLTFREADPYVHVVAEEIGVPYSIQAMNLGPGNNIMIRFSPDGQKMVWQSDREGNWNIYLANVDGSLPQPITVNPADDEMACFTPDGKAILFVSSRDDPTPKALGEKNREIYFLKLADRTPIRLTHNAVDDWYPVFGKDSSAFIFVSEQGDLRTVNFVNKHSNLFTYSLVDSSIQSLTNDPWDNTSPAPLPDGRWAWVQIKDNEYRILAGFPGKTHQVLFSGPDPKSGLHASPDGGRLVFYMERRGNIDIYMLEIAGKSVKKLTAAPAMDLYPVFSPDGKAIYFSSNSSGEFNLYKIGLDQPITREELLKQLKLLTSEARASQHSE